MFGKLPALGDFVARGLDFPLRDAIDAWLSQQMQQGRDRYGPEFEGRYDASPAWCFVDCDPDGQWSGGALCASVDAAGRRFPVVLAAPAGDCATAAALAGGCLETLYTAFANGWDADALHGQPVDPVDLGWAPDGPGWALLAEDGPAAKLAGRFPDGVVTTMMELAA
jgi:type VI secretion system ImpM family protein